MLKSAYIIYLHSFRTSAAKFLRTILLVLSLLNFLTSSFIYSKSDVLTDKGDIPVQTFIDSDLTSPGKLFVIQNETLRINENLKVQPLHLMNAALLLKTDLQKKYFSEILTSEDRIFLSYVFIESTQPRSPPLSLS